MNTDIVRALCVLVFAVLTAALGNYVTDHAVVLSLGQWLAILAGTFGVSRILAREKVCEPVRKACERTPLSEIVNCPRCIGAWIALALTTGIVFEPVYSLMVCGLFGVVGANIILHEITGILVAISAESDRRMRWVEIAAGKKDGNV